MERRSLEEQAYDLTYQILRFWFREDRNAWVANEAGMIYVRRAKRPNLTDEDVLDLATISIAEEYQGQGILTSVLDKLEMQTFPIFIENVMDERLQRFFLKRGYMDISVTDDRTPCFYRPSQSRR